MKLLITGSAGYLGSQLYKELSKDHNCVSINRNVFDLTNFNETKKWFKNKFFDAVIHTAIKGGSRLQKDSSDIIDANINMYLNLVKHQNFYNKFINIGSGAEIYDPFSPYGISKRTIFESLQDKQNFYSLRVFAIFNHLEIDTRFIKSNITRYIKKEPMTIHQNKLMDFMYFDDFIKIIKHYLTKNTIPKNLDCVYENKHTLSDISTYINSLNTHKVKIIFQKDSLGIPYTGQYTDLGIQYIGLVDGIVKTFNEIKKIYI